MCGKTKTQKEAVKSMNLSGTKKVMVKKFCKWREEKANLLGTLRLCVPMVFSNCFQPYIFAGAILYPARLKVASLSAPRRRKIVSEVIKEIALFRKVTATN